ncbi:MAG: hypothetical protein ISS16_12130 [Ignavibacteria bacterium]|nr:hypothetical protein [Ignavibacteria bacterium]
MHYRIKEKCQKYTGNKSFVILSFEEYKGLLEDIHDLGIMAERRDEPKISFKEFEKGLNADCSY